MRQGASNLVFLFDIDGTLLRLRDGTGFPAFQAAFLRSFPDAPAPRIREAPETDFALLLASLPKKPTPYATTLFYEKLASELTIRLTESPPIPCVNATSLVRELSRTGSQMGIVTGNAMLPARVKLEAAGFDDLFGLMFTGEYASTKTAVLAEAIDALGRMKERCVLVGDSLADVSASTELGVPAVFVASGWTDITDLSQKTAMPVVEKLPPSLEEFLALVLLACTMVNS